MGSEKVANAHWPERDLAFLQRVAREFVRLAPDRVALLTAGGEGQGAFVLCAGERATMDLAAAGRGVADVLGGRGGGSGRIFQGKATALSRRAEALARLETLG
jgi:alanyl-tRNA synthetase